MVTLRDVLAVSCKVLGLYFFVLAVANGTVVFAYGYYTGDSVRYLVTQSGVLAAYAVSAFLLLRFSERVSCLLIREDKPVTDAAGPDWRGSLFVLCIRVVGIVVMVNAIQSITVGVGQYAFLRSASLPAPMVWSRGLGAAAYLVLGMYLIAGGRLFVRLGERAQPKGKESQ
jgi:hypothetical protein